MAKKMVKLVTFEATDGAILQGALHAAETSADNSRTAVLFLHGAGSNFYGSTLSAELIPPLTRSGNDVFLINTRGHDIVCTFRKPDGACRGGAAYEIVDECRYDIRGAVDWLLGEGHRNIVLMGHSLGALKATYSQAHDPHADISHIVAISPPRLSYTAFCQGPRRREFLQTISRADQLVAAGEGEHLLEVNIPLPLLICAAGYVDKYGPAERYNLLKFAGEVTKPLFILLGEQEVSGDSAAFGGLDSILRGLPFKSEDVDVRVIENADHFYRGATSALAVSILNWLGWK